MAKTITSLNDLKSVIMPNVNETLEEDIAPVVKSAIKYYIEKDVYNQYSPTQYERRGKNGGLLDKNNMNSDLVASGVLEVSNDTLGTPYYYAVLHGGHHEGEKRRRRSKNAGKLIAGVIETGEGYDIENSDLGYCKPRPFMEDTYNALVNEDIVPKVFKRGLELRGFEVK